MIHCRRCGAGLFVSTVTAWSAAVTNSSSSTAVRVSGWHGDGFCSQDCEQAQGIEQALDDRVDLRQGTIWRFFDRFWCITYAIETSREDLYISSSSHLFAYIGGGSIEVGEPWSP